MSDVRTIPSDRQAGVTTAGTEFVDVLIVGAGISGIGMGHHLKTQCPQKSFAIVEAGESFGGTWRLHTYPGIRSDSDLYTFGYRFKPWSGNPIAEADMILDYLDEAIQEDHLQEKIRYRHKVVSADWSSERQRWLVDIERGETNEPLRIECAFLWMCQGYYDYDKPYTPDFEGMQDFEGPIVHPQLWPGDLDYKDKRVVVIGSGATAATLIPNMADDCEHITMLQRSPTYFWTGENRNELADRLRDLEVPEEWIHDIVRRDLLKTYREIQEYSAKQPDLVREMLREDMRQYLGEDFDFEPDFTPSYRPWQQRLAYVPEGDLFKCMADGKASVVTDHIERFTRRGILLQSGRELQADIIITATGFNLLMAGGIPFSVDGNGVDVADALTYRGVMLSGLPNFSLMFGYLRTSWTMRVDLVGDFICRLLNHMDGLGATSCTPTLGQDEQDMELHPWISPEEFNPGYLTRSLHLAPKQGDHAPWTFNVDYYQEKDELPAVDLDEAALVYEFGEAGATRTGSAGAS